MKSFEFEDAELKSLNDNEMQEIQGGDFWDTAGGILKRAGAFVNGMVDEICGAPSEYK